jgi:hypothetical protein
MIRDMRNKTLEEGDMVCFVGQATLIDGLVIAVSAPMVQHTPMGPQPMQKMSIVVKYEMMVAQGAGAPVLLFDKKGGETSKEATEDISKGIKALEEGKTSGGGSIIVG